MNLAALLGDDEHTGRDDAYVRILKSRKWLILSSALSLGWSYGFLVPAPFSILISKVNLPAWIWEQATNAGLAYSLAIYCLLLVQLGVRYGKVLRDRQIDQTSQRLSELRERHDTLNATYFQARREREDPSMDDATRAMAAHQLDTIVSELQANQDEMQDAARRLAADVSPLYMFSEYLIDALRVLSPLAFGLLATRYALT